jgi:hypothetical protein
MINKLITRMTGDPTYANINYYDDFPILFTIVESENRRFRAFDTFHEAYKYAKRNRSELISIHVQIDNATMRELKDGKIGKDKKWGSKGWFSLLSELVEELNENSSSTMSNGSASEESIRRQLQTYNCESDFTNRMCYGTNWKKGF